MTHQFLTESEAQITIEYKQDDKFVTATYPRVINLALEYEPVYQEVTIDGVFLDSAKVFRDTGKLTLSAELLPNDDGKYGKFFSTKRELGAGLRDEYDNVVARRAGKGVEVFIGGRWRKVHD